MGAPFFLPYRCMVQVTHRSLRSSYPMYSYYNGNSCLTALCMDPSLDFPWELDLDFQSTFADHSSLTPKVAGPFEAQSEFVLNLHVNKTLSQVTLYNRWSGTFVFVPPYVFLSPSSWNSDSRLTWDEEANQLTVKWDISNIITTNTYLDFETVVTFIPAPLDGPPVQAIEQRVTRLDDTILIKRDLAGVNSIQPCCPADSGLLASRFRTDFG